MRKLIALGVVVLLGAAVGADEMSLDEVVGKYYDAVGSPAAWAEIEAVRARGQITGGWEGSFVRSFRRPLSSHLEFTIQGITGEQAYDGEQAWIFWPFMGMSEPRPAPPVVAEASRQQSDFEGPLVGWEAKGHQVTLVGKGDSGGNEDRISFWFDDQP